MRSKPVQVQAIVFALTAAMPGLAWGEILTYAMEGTVRNVRDPVGWLSFAQLEDRVSFAISFNSDTPHLNNSGSWHQWFDGISGAGKVGDALFTAPHPGFVVQGPTDFFRMSSTLEINGIQGDAEFGLTGYTGGQLSHLHLLTEPYLLGDFSGKAFRFGFIGPMLPGESYPTYLTISGDIDSFYVVPEPRSIGIFVVALTHSVRRRR